MDEYLRDDYRGEDFSDEEEGALTSSSDEEEAVDPYGKVNVRKCQSLNKISPARVDENEEDMDDFEKEMNLELENRAEAAQKSFLGNGSLPSTSSNSRSQESKTYDDVYFDSDEEVNEPMDKKNRKTNDELLYDPRQDDQDQKWVDDLRKTYQSKFKKIDSSKSKPLDDSDAVLNCPACFIVVCLDCQRHDLYKDQYRAMFVMNCTVDVNKKLAYPETRKASKKRKKKEVEQLYNPVKCDSCQTQIAVYDDEEVYHFFNVIASHS